MDVIERYGGCGTFFVDVYNRTTVSEDLIAHTVREIDERSHEVALHTHPAFPIGRRGYGMEQTMMALPLAKQSKFVAEGAAMIERWTGKRPVSHRAGGYGANYDTLRALAEHGIPYDSSVFHGYPRCGLNEPPLTINRPRHHNGVLEIPVSVTRNELHAGPVRLVAMNKKLDPDWCSPRELERQVDALMAPLRGPIVLFLHSYSLLDIERGFRPSPAAVARLDRILAYVTARGAELVTLATAAKTWEQADETVPDALPSIRAQLAGGDIDQTFWMMSRLRWRHLRILRDLIRRDRKPGVA
jgi:peptidoglycan/xylan/chitin deacetylase (PgdA/CDA1 family)